MLGNPTGKAGGGGDSSKEDKNLKPRGSCITSLMPNISK